MMTLTRPAAEVYLPTGERDWDAEDAAHAAWVAGYRDTVRQQARWYGLALAGMDGNDRHHARGRRTVDAIRRDFARWAASLARFDPIAADALRREVSDLMDLRERHPDPAQLWDDIASDPDAAFDFGYSLGESGRGSAPAPIGYDGIERRAFYLGLRAAEIDREGGL